LPIAEAGSQRIGEIGEAEGANCTRLYRSPALAGAGVAWLQYHRYVRPDLAFTRLPLPWATLVLKLGIDERWRTLGEREWQSFPHLALRGHAASPTHGRDDGIGVNEYLSALVEPWAVAQLFGIPARDALDRVIGLDDLWGSEARRLEERLAEARAPEDKLGVLEAALLGRSTETRRFDSRIAKFIRSCRFGAGGPRVKRLCREIGLSDRRFRELFGEAIGLSPKRWARLERFSATARDLHPSSWGTRDDFAAPDYFDQAHAIHEFRRHAGITPQAYRRAKAGGDPRVFMVEGWHGGSPEPA
jgi:AraC-like DNA-binding protein